jgi:DNA helicase-2/ATP-dependent DNA helicase PcrA
VIADLHIHSKYSGATSEDMNLINLENQGKTKGLNILGTGDNPRSTQKSG